MRAVRFTQWQTFPTIEEVDRPQPGPGEVVLKVAGDQGRAGPASYLVRWRR